MDILMHFLLAGAGLAAIGVVIYFLHVLDQRWGPRYIMTAVAPCHSLNWGKVRILDRQNGNAAISDWLSEDKARELLNRLNGLPYLTGKPSDDAELFRLAAERMTPRTPEAALAQLVEMGIYKPDGSLHENYGGPKK